MFKQFIEKWLGLDKIKESALKEVEDAIALAKEANQAALEAELARKIAEEATVVAGLSLKDRATRKKEPWVSVLDTQVNKDNVRNGFFELDWNTFFIAKLISEGYGVEDDNEEEIIDRWFRELCANVVVDGDYGGPDINTGVIDINSIKKNNQ
jgi:hypothetical protein